MSKSDEVKSDEVDPVVAEYEVYLTDELVDRLMLFQYPNRDRQHAYTEANHAKPSEVRFKPRAGLVEVDIPLSTSEHFNREKAMEWGQAVRKSTFEKAGGSQGLAGGFGIGSSAIVGTSTTAGSKNAMADADEAVEPSHLLHKQVLGGQVEPVTDEQPIYMVGAFRNNQFHLSRVSSVVQLRPQFHHIDAMLEQERLVAKGHRDALNPPRQQEARAVQMAVKSVDGEDFDTTQTMKALKDIQEERWKVTDYLDENSDEAWAAYEGLFVKDVGHASKLQSAMTSAEYLDAISPPKIQVTAAGKSAPIRKTESRVPHVSGQHTEGIPDGNTPRGHLALDDDDDDDDDADIPVAA